MKRAKIEEVNRKLHLFETLIKSVMMYGVEIRGWEERPAIEKIQGAFIKMIMGVSRNTLDYLWRREMGRVKVASTALKQMFKFILRIERMEPERWVQIFWNEIKRGVKNNKETNWGG